jgi:hypothetical protein
VPDRQQSFATTLAEYLKFLPDERAAGMRLAQQIISFDFESAQHNLQTLPQ